MANPFYIEPLGGFNAGDIVGNAIRQYKENQAQEDQMAQRQEFMDRTQEILSLADSGDYSRVPELLETNPDLFNVIRREQQAKRAGIAEQDRQVAQQAENEFDSLLLTSDESELPALIARAKANPLIDFDEEDEAMSLPQLKTMASLRLASNAPEFFKTLQSSQSTEQTATQREFDQYQQLKESDPEQAKEFGMAAGFIDDGKKRLFKVSENPDGSVTKYFSDGTESQSSPTETIKTPDMQKGMSLNKAKSVMAGAKEYQTKSAGFAMRLRDSIDQMNRLTDKSIPNYVEPARAALIIKALGDGTLGNVALSPNEQEYMVNANDALFAILRPETGAAITDQEMRQYSRLYLPQPGESENATRAKKRKLENQFKSLRARAPQVYDASRIVIGEGPKAPEPQAQAPQSEQVQQFVIQNHPQFGNVTEEDIQQTMTANNLTREQVLARLGNQ